MITVTLKPITRTPTTRPAIERIPFPEMWGRGIQFLAKPDATVRAKRRLVLTGSIPAIVAQRFGDRAVIKSIRRAS